MGQTRYIRFLKERYRILLGYTGLINVLVGGLILLPCLVLVGFPDELDLVWGFLLPGLGSAAFGASLWRLFLPRGGESLSLAEGGVVVVLSWGFAILVGTVPFLTVGGLNFIQALFESTSGWTTTGLSVVDVSQASHMILLFRSTMQFAGGAGLAIIMLSALAGPAGTGLSAAEGRTDQLMPHIRQSAKMVLTLYAGYTVMGFAALRMAGMDWFDAVNHAFCALSTGGFSTRVESIGYWNSASVEAVVIILMLLGNTSFLTSYTLLHGNFRAVCRNGELRLQALLIPGMVLFVFFGVCAGLYPTLGKQMRVAIFEVTTALSTTGFSTVGYGDWSGLGWLILIALMIIGGSAGSTAGGIKQYRVYALFRALLWEFRKMLLPQGTVTEPDVWIGESRRFLCDRDLRQIALFVCLYLGTLTVGTGILAAYGHPLRESLFEFASVLGTVGLSTGITSPTAPAGVLGTEILGMFLGRLEFFIVIIGLSRLVTNITTMTASIWKKD
ncbi:MAG: TrkH family potassium uptake protein [Deltaproteobacteria bacterium]|nr:TrkH family potassium uptake protein [Deltaproteobacteria bacterium]